MPLSNTEQSLSFGLKEILEHLLHHFDVSDVRRVRLLLENQRPRGRGSVDSQQVPDMVIRCLTLFGLSWLAGDCSYINYYRWAQQTQHLAKSSPNSDSQIWEQIKSLFQTTQFCRDSLHNRWYCIWGFLNGVVKASFKFSFSL